MDRAWEVQSKTGELQGQTIQDFLYFEGMFNPIARFAFTNALDEPFVSYWDGVKYTIRERETVKLKHHLAQKFTKELVDELMRRDGKGMMLGVPEQRKPYEDRVLALLPPESGTEMEVIRQEFIEQVNHDASRPEGVADEPVDALTLDFDDLKPKSFSEPAKPKAEAKAEKAKRK